MIRWEEKRSGAKETTMSAGSVDYLRVRALNRDVTLDFGLKPGEQTYEIISFEVYFRQSEIQSMS
jgi:hypothetical protein